MRERVQVMTALLEYQVGRALPSRPRGQRFENFNTGEVPGAPEHRSGVDQAHRLLISLDQIIGQGVLVERVQQQPVIQLNSGPLTTSEALQRLGAQPENITVLSAEPLLNQFYEIYKVATGMRIVLSPNGTQAFFTDLHQGARVEKAGLVVGLDISAAEGIFPAMMALAEREHPALKPDALGVFTTISSFDSATPDFAEEKVVAEGAKILGISDRTTVVEIEQLYDDKDRLTGKRHAVIIR